MAYVGQGIKGGTFSVLDTSGNTYNGSNVTFDLGTHVSSPAQLIVSHDGVIQKPVTDYILASGGTQITFTTAPASGASIFITEISGAVGAPMNRDINGDELILDADGDTSITADTDDQIDFRIAGADDLRMTANAINVLSGTTLTIDSGATITNSGTANGFGALAGIDDQSSSNDDQLTIADGAVTINEDGDDVDFRVETSGNSYTHMIFVESGAGEFNINDDASEGTITFNQAAEDGNIISFKSSDVAHGVTTRAETDSYMTIQKTNGPDGGAQVYHFRENAENAMYYHGVGVGSLGTTKSVNESGLISIRAHLKGSGTDTDGTITSNGNMLTIHAHNTTRFIFDAEGDLHADSSSTTFDTYDDAQLARAFDLSHGRGVVDSKFDKFVAYNHEKLAELQLVGREKDGTPNHFINVTGMQRLHNGAIWQQYEKHNQLLEAVYDLAKEAVGEEKANAILDKHEVKRLQ
mgnify:CR=1 FL=1